MNKGEQLDFIRLKAAHRKALEIFKEAPPPYPFRVNQQVREVAEGIACVFWEGEQRFSFPGGKIGGVKIDMGGERSQTFRQQFPNQLRFKQWSWPYFVPMARDAMTDMLKPDSGVSDYLKNKVMEDLIDAYHAPTYDPEALNELIARAVVMSQSKKVMSHGRRPRER